MQQKRKQNEFSIKIIFQNWLNLEANDKVVYLFGNTAVGKTTACHLLKKYIDNDPDPNLKLVEKKKDYQYECEGEINPKVTKPLTIYPKKFQMKSKDIAIIEIPSRIYSLEKKRPFLDKILNVVGLAHAAQRACFLFMVDAKNTSGRCEPWKKCFQHILDCFSLQYLNDKTFNSIGFIISKGANQHNKQVYLSRIQDFQKLFAQEDRQNQYIQLLKTVLNKQNLCVFSKTTQNQEITKRDIEEMHSLIQKLLQNSIPLQKQLPKEHKLIKIEPVQLDKQEENCLKTFNSTLEIILEFFAKFFQQLFNSQQPIDILKFKGKSSTNSSQKATPESQGTKSYFLKSIWPTDLNTQLKTSQLIKNKLQQLFQKSRKSHNFYQNPIGKASLLIEFKQRIQEPKKNKNALNQFLQILAQHGLIVQSNHDLPELEALYLELIEFALFEERFGSIIKNIDYKELLKEKGVSRQFKDNHKELVQRNIHSDFINNKLSLNISSEQAKKYSEIIQKFFPKGQTNKQYEDSIILLKRNLLLKNVDWSDPQKSIAQINQLLNKLINKDKAIQRVLSIKDKPTDSQKKQIDFLNTLAILVAKTLLKYDRPDLCIQVFEDNGDFYSALQCYRSSLIKFQKEQVKNSKQIIETFNRYINLLIKLQLFQKALQQCYEFAQIFRQIRPQINKKRRQIKESRLKKFDEVKEKQFEQKFLSIAPKLSRLYQNKQILQKIKQIAQKIRK